MDRDRIRRRTDELFKAQGGLCHWCGELCRTRDDPLYFRITGALSGKAATLDHLYSRFHKLRKKQGIQKFVMSCATCNGQRSHLETKYIYAEEHRRRTKNGTK